MAIAAEQRAQKSGDVNTNTSVNQGAPAQVTVNGGKLKLTPEDFKPLYTLDALPSAFNHTEDSELITTIQLGEKINGLFRPLFQDYAGCVIRLTTVGIPVPNAVGMNGFVDPNSMVQQQVGYVAMPRYEVDLYFQSGANAGRCVEGAVKNIRAISDNGKNAPNDMAARIARLNQRARPGKNFTLTDETKDMLAEFFAPGYCEQTLVEREFLDPTDPEGKRTRIEKMKVPRPAYDKRLIYEETENVYTTSPNAYGVYVKVTNLDLIAILRKLWGDKNERGNYVDYEVRAIRPVNTFNGMMNPSSVVNELLHISRLDTVKVKKMYDTLGMFNTLASSLPIIRN